MRRAVLRPLFSCAIRSVNFAMNVQHQWANSVGLVFVPSNAMLAAVQLQFTHGATSVMCMCRAWSGKCCLLGPPWDRSRARLVSLFSSTRTSGDGPRLVFAILFTGTLCATCTLVLYTFSSIHAHHVNCNCVLSLYVNCNSRVTEGNFPRAIIISFGTVFSTDR